MSVLHFTLLAVVFLEMILSGGSIATVGFLGLFLLLLILIFE